MRIDESEGHWAKADSPIDKSFEGDSKVIAESFAQPEKQFLPRISTDDGIQTDERDVHLSNAPFSMRDSVEPDSKLTVESAQQ
jgi:hypothetical protein